VARTRGKIGFHITTFLKSKNSQFFFHPHHSFSIFSNEFRSIRGIITPKIPNHKKKSSLFLYNSPLSQIIHIGLVCFCCPGMFNALPGMGGGGQVNSTPCNTALTVQNRGSKVQLSLCKKKSTIKSSFYHDYTVKDTNES
jgi:hypothetical protein